MWPLLGLPALGDWTDDARRPVVFRQDAYPEHAGSHDYTRAVLRARPEPLPRVRSRPGRRQAQLAFVCLLGLLSFALVDAVSAETWRGLTVAPEHCCASYDKKRDSGG